jgi:hypothetical protein
MDKYIIECWSNLVGRWLASGSQTADQETTEKKLAQLEQHNKDVIYRMRKLDGAAYHQTERLF